MMGKFSKEKVMDSGGSQDLSFYFKSIFIFVDDIFNQ